MQFEYALGRVQIPNVRYNYYMDPTLTSVGRPRITKEQIDEIFHKLEPYLRTGLSLYKACLEAQIPTSTAYDLYSENKWFAERIDTSRNYCAVLVNDIITKELERIKTKAGILPLESSELKLIQMVALHSSTTTRDEFEDRSEEEISLTKKTTDTMSDEEFRNWVFELIDQSQDK